MNQPSRTQEKPNEAKNGEASSSTPPGNLSQCALLKRILERRARGQKATAQIPQPLPQASIQTKQETGSAVAQGSREFPRNKAPPLTGLSVELSKPPSTLEESPREIGKSSIGTNWNDIYEGDSVIITLPKRESKASSTRPRRAKYGGKNITSSGRQKEAPTDSQPKAKKATSPLIKAPENERSCQQYDDPVKRCFATQQPEKKKIHLDSKALESRRESVVTEVDVNNRQSPQEPTGFPTPKPSTVLRQSQQKDPCSTFEGTGNFQDFAWESPETSTRNKAISISETLVDIDAKLNSQAASRNTAQQDQVRKSLDPNRGQQDGKGNEQAN